MNNQPNIPLCRLIIVLLCMAGSSLGYGQLKADTAFPEIAMELSQSQYISMQRLKGKKLNLTDVKMRVNNKEVIIEDLHIRGKTTLQFKKKSLSVELEQAIPVKIGNKRVLLKDFDLLNLVMDRNLWHNRWAFSVLSQLGVFPLAYTYCTLKINNEPNGIYLLVEKPKHAMAALNSPYMIRRGPNHIIEKDYDKDLSREEVKAYRKQFHELYKPGGMHNLSLFNHLEKLLDTENYFTWLGFNYLVMNGDYSDELFLYIDPDTGRFGIVPWDYDDLFREAPHEGRKVRNEAYRDRLIFSLEDPLDKMIVADDLLYSKYLQAFERMLQQVDSTMIADTTQEVLQELKVLGAEPENREMSRYLDREAFRIDDAARDIEASMQFLTARRILVLNVIHEKSGGD